MTDVIVIGGGAAGMMAAVTAAQRGRHVRLFEKNEKLGKKLFITGKGRCNLTNAGQMEDLFEAVVSNPKFLYSSFYSFTNEQTVDFFERLGVQTKTERGNRVFPCSDHSSDIIRALEREMQQLGVEIFLNTEVKEVMTEDGAVQGVKTTDGRLFPAESIIVATGGISYPSTGSTGDGYRFAKQSGHQVTDLLPSLVPLETEESWVPELQGLSLRNIQIRILDGEKELYKEFGEMLFTHYGVSGPVILSASSIIGKQLKRRKLVLAIDLKPALNMEQLDRRILREFESNQNRQFKNAMDALFPAKLRPVMIRLSGISPEKKVNEVTKEERHAFAKQIKDMRLTLLGPRGFREAIITKGGVSVKEIDPGTMESRKVKGLYFAGEVLDLDALTGGFNLQIAWSTGYLAGLNG